MRRWRFDFTKVVNEAFQAYNDNDKKRLIEAFGFKIHVKTFVFAFVLLFF